MKILKQPFRFLGFLGILIILAAAMLILLPEDEETPAVIGESGPEIVLVAPPYQNPYTNAEGSHTTFMLFTVQGQALEPERDHYNYKWNLTNRQVSVDAYSKSEGSCEVVASDQLLCAEIPMPYEPAQKEFTYEIFVNYVDAKGEVIGWGVLVQEGKIHLDTLEHQLLKSEGLFDKTSAN